MVNYMIYKTRFDLDIRKFTYEVLALFANKEDAQIFANTINTKIMPDFVQVMPIAPWE